jgi:phage-related protein
MANGEETIEIPLRPLVWMGDSRKNIREFPGEVRVSVGYALQVDLIKQRYKDAVAREKQQ